MLVAESLCSKQHLLLPDPIVFFKNLSEPVLKIPIAQAAGTARAELQPQWSLQGLLNNRWLASKATSCCFMISAITETNNDHVIG